jgi:hypothetical protein
VFGILLLFYREFAGNQHPDALLFDNEGRIEVGVFGKTTVLASEVFAHSSGQSPNSDIGRAVKEKAATRAGTARSNARGDGGKPG